MNTCATRIAVGGLAAVCLWLATPVQGQEPRLIRPPEHRPTALTGVPPFAHWDLRELPDCRVPWTFTGGWVPDIDENGTPDTQADRDEIAHILRLAFLTWSRVSPALVDFIEARNSPLVPGNARDGHNTLGFRDAPDDVQLVLPGDDSLLLGAGVPPLPGMAVIHPGRDGRLATTPRGNEEIGLMVFAGAPMPFIVEGDPTDGVVSSVPNDQAGVRPFMPIVGPGPDGILQTIPEGDDIVFGGLVFDGGNGIAETRANNASYHPGSLGTTAVFMDNSTGAILEADIVFSSNLKFVNNPKVTRCPPAATPEFNLLDTAIHETGHFMGIHHPLFANPVAPDAADGLTPSMFAAACPWSDRNNFVQSLHPSDIESANFLYTPDLGDAPDPLRAKFNEYPSHERAKGGGRTLNAMQLDTPARGAVQLLGFTADDPPGAPLEYPYHFEHLGLNAIGAGENPTPECSARQPDGDLNDDGVVFPKPMMRGGASRFEVSIRHTAQPGRYAADPRKTLYFNGYLDYNANGTWEANERRLWWSGTDTASGAFSPNFRTADFGTNQITLAFDLLVPPEAKAKFWCRFRLDYGENEGRVAAVSTDLAPAVGVAQFGEVEDYLCETIPFRGPPRREKQKE